MNEILSITALVNDKTLTETETQGLLLLKLLPFSHDASVFFCRLNPIEHEHTPNPPQLKPALSSNAPRSDLTAAYLRAAVAGKIRSIFGI